MPRPMRNGRALLALVAAATLVVACRGERKDDGELEPDDDATAVEDGSDTAAAETDAQLITSSLVAASPGSLSLESSSAQGHLAVQAFGDGPKAVYFPRGCLQVEHVAGSDTATYTFNRCIGPNGLRAVTGKVTARYHLDGSALVLNLSATDLAVNKASVDWSATAIIRQASDSEREMTWDAQLAGTTGRGRTFDRTNHYTLRWTLGEACFALEGRAKGQVDGREIETEIEAFQRCRRGCPDAGGKISVTNVTKGRTFQLLYDGTNRATFVGPNGATASIPLLCEP